MFGNDASVLADYDTVGVSMDLDRSSDGTGRDRVFVVVEAHQGGKSITVCVSVSLRV
jgi:hypothetical protein